MRRLFIVVFLLMFVFRANATHQRAAEISYKHLQGNTYSITLIMFTRTSSPADDTRDSMPIKWGDNTEEEIPRIIFQDLGNDVTYNVYKGIHTFPGDGEYTISVEDPNRNNGVVNIPNSVNIPMYVESKLVINSFLGPNNSVVLSNPPFNVGCVHKLFVHNPGAYDPDGDSLAFKLAVCKGHDGMDIPGYTFPQASEYFIINEHTGDLIWKNPVLQGEYNVAFIVEEWRDGIMIGSVRRDMQINIVVCDHDPPVFDSLSDTCAIAGDFITFPVSATDPDSTTVILEGSGGPFYVSESPAIINPDPGIGKPTATTVFSWQTTCSHIRKNPYNAVFKATDNGFPVGLTTFDNSFIKIISPPPENLTAIPENKTIKLHWDTIECSNATGYKIYRKVDEDTWNPDYCQTGVPAYTGYEPVKTISGRNNTSYVDDNNGKGLTYGIKYCYRVTGLYYDNVESKPSDTACSRLKRETAIITNVTNDSINPEKGWLHVIWVKPTELDTILHPGPFQYQLFRNYGSGWNNPEKVAVLNGLNDTVFLDSTININSKNKPYYYRVDIYGEQGFINSSETAASPFISLTPYDKRLRINISADVPWINDEYIIYRKAPEEDGFSVLDTVSGTVYDDKGLENFKEYSYYVVTSGHYSLSGIPDPLLNISEIATGIPQDLEPPCKPVLSVKTDCDNIENNLTWSVPYDSCNYDVMKYILYYSSPGPDNLEVLTEITDAADTTFTHSDIDKVVGCYGVIAVDSAGNKSDMSDLICVNYDACPNCKLPNVFTPNGDGINDFFEPMKNMTATVDHVEFSIFNRWGREVYYTEDPNIKWDGKDKTTGKLLPDGTYFYECKSYLITNNGMVTAKSQGSILLLSGNK